jgi:hypothetical protein
VEQISDLELTILHHCLERGYKYATFNGGHVRVLDTDKEPELKGGMYRVELDDDSTYFGDTLFVPGLFNTKEYKVIELSTLSFQDSLF